MKNDGRLIIEVSRAYEGYDDYKTVKKFFNGNGEFECIYTNDKEGRPLSKDFDYNFVFVNQEKDVEEIIRRILNSTNKTKICIAVHTTGKPIDKVTKGVEKSNHIERVISKPKEFIHENRCILWEAGLKSFVVESIGNNFNKYEERFDNLWKLLAPSIVEELHSLRAQLLTPFIPFHLAYQKGTKIDDDWKKILGDSVGGINDALKSKLTELLSIKEISNEVKERLIGYLDNLLLLCNTFLKADVSDALEKKKLEEKKEEIVSCIEIFAACLENVVNYIEFGDVLECQ